MARAALLFGLAALIAAPRAADAQTAGLRTLTWQSATAGCSAVPMLSSPCITGGYYFMYDAMGSVLGTSKTESERLHCEDYSLIGVATNGNTQAGSLLIFDTDGANYTATFTASSLTLNPGSVANCSVSFTTTTQTNPQTSLGSRFGTLYYRGATPSTCPVSTCATAGYYYIYDGHEGLGLVPLSTNATDGCVVLLAGMGRGANANGGTYSAAYVASSAFLSLGLDLVLPIAGGITGNYNARLNSFTMIVGTPAMATALRVNQGCQYNFAFTSANSTTSAAAAAASRSVLLTFAAVVLAVLAALL